MDNENGNKILGEGNLFKLMLKFAVPCVLRDREKLIRIFVYAPENYRIARIAEVYGDSPAEAQKFVKKSDKARAAYYSNISHLKWGDAHNYDLLVDSSIGVEQTAALIADYVTHKF